MRYLSALDQPLGSTRTLLKESGDDGQVDSTVRRTVLPGGLRVVTESMAGARSVSLGLWVAVGSRDEAPSLAGVTHFLEHLLFKGTGRRTALDISAELDAVGGELNAFTAKEYTCYHARVLDADLPLAVDVICDMVTDSRLPGDEVEAERNVILEEIAMHEDDHDDVVHDAFVSALYGDTPLGRPIIGTPESIVALSRRQIQGYYHRRYTADSLIFTAAGRVDHAQVVSLVKQAFERSGALGDATSGPKAVRPAIAQPVKPASVVRIERPAEQTTFVAGVPAFARNHPRRYALGILNAALGGGTSSRLFQEVRERRGLAYTIYTFGSQHVDAGYFAVGGACMPGKLNQVLGICRDELAKIAKDGLTADEFERGRGQLRGGLVMGLEDSSARMTRIGKAELVPGGLVSIDTALSRINGVTLDEVNDVARELLDVEPTLAALGPAKALNKLG